MTLIQIGRNEPPVRDNPFELGTPHVCRERKGVKEDEWTHPTTMYGCNKLYCEQLGHYYARHYKQLAAETASGRVDFRCVRFPGLTPETAYRVTPVPLSVSPKDRPRPAWYDGVWSSVKVAGNPPTKIQPQPPKRIVGGLTVRF